jgi:PAS domain S-box-containing protein
MLTSKIKPTNKDHAMMPANTQNDTRTRIENINRMIMEVASGNFAYKLERSDRNDELDALAVTVNMMAEEMKSVFMHRGHLNDNYKDIAGMTFVLDSRLHIQTFNSGVTRILFFDAQELSGKPLAEFLTPESREAWKNLKSRMHDDDPHLTVELSFKTKQALVVPALCSVSTLVNTSRNQRKILITAIETIADGQEAENELRYVVEESKADYGSSTGDGQSRIPVFREPDLKRIREAHDRILHDLLEPLSLKELAHTFGINEFKLKHGFKQLYGTTIFRFIMDERLKKASLLLQNTDIPIKNISEMTGFKSFPHFSKAFKKRFGYCPSDLKRASASPKL